MPYLKLMNESYSNPDAVECVIQYIIRNSLYVDSTTCSTEPTECICQMKYIKALWGKNRGRQIRYFILSFSRQNEYVQMTELIQLGRQIAGYYDPNYQTIWAIHRSPEGNYHIHVVFNTVSYQDGRMYREGREDLGRLARYIRGLLPDTVGELNYNYGHSNESMELL